MKCKQFISMLLIPIIVLCAASCRTREFDNSSFKQNSIENVKTTTFAGTAKKSNDPNFYLFQSPFKRFALRLTKPLSPVLKIQMALGTTVQIKGTTTSEKVVLEDKELTIFQVEEISHITTIVGVPTKFFEENKTLEFVEQSTKKVFILHESDSSLSLSFVKLNTPYFASILLLGNNTNGTHQAAITLSIKATPVWSCKISKRDNQPLDLQLFVSFFPYVNANQLFVKREALFGTELSAFGSGECEFLSKEGKDGWSCHPKFGEGMTIDLPFFQKPKSKKDIFTVNWNYSTNTARTNEEYICTYNTNFSMFDSKFLD